MASDGVAFDKQPSLPMAMLNNTSPGYFVATSPRSSTVGGAIKDNLRGARRSDCLGTRDTRPETGIKPSGLLRAARDASGCRELTNNIRFRHIYCA